MGFVPYLPVLMEKIRKKVGYPSSAQRMRCPDRVRAIGVPGKKGRDNGDGEHTSIPI